MNRKQVLHHLDQARVGIEESIDSIRAAPEYNESEYWVEMQHIYHHLNTAWNSRDVSDLELEAATDADFNRWSAFPLDLPMMEV
jgi:hypothetical protein